MIKNAFILGVSVLIGFAAAIICALMAGAGHGTYLPAKLLFPVTMISTGFLEEITIPFILVGLLQFPIYAMAFLSGSQRWGTGRTIIGITLVHVITAFSALAFSSGYFPN